MGRPKGSLEWNGTTLAERAASALRPLCGSVLISVAPGSPNPAPGFSVVEDPAPGGLGPLAGIATAFGSSGKADLLVLACDYPEVGTALLRVLLRSATPGDDLIFPVDPVGRDHPLVGYWRRSAEPVVVAALAANQLKVLSLLPDLVVRRVRPGEYADAGSNRPLRNLNWPEDLPG